MRNPTIITYERLALEKEPNSNQIQIDEQCAVAVSTKIFEILNRIPYILTPCRILLTILSILDKTFSTL